MAQPYDSWTCEVLVSRTAGNILLGRAAQVTPTPCGQPMYTFTDGPGGQFAYCRDHWQTTHPEMVMDIPELDAERLLRAYREWAKDREPPLYWDLILQFIDHFRGMGFREVADEVYKDKR